KKGSKETEVPAEAAPKPVEKPAETPEPAAEAKDAPAAPAKPAAPEAEKAPTAAATPDDAILALARESHLEEKLLRDLDSVLRRRGQVAIEGPTGVGKTYLARRFAAVFAGSAQRVRFVQLHPSY